jgi:hypothetical protein
MVGFCEKGATQVTTRVHRPVGDTGAAWPLTTLAQQPVMPVIGFLHMAPLDETRTGRDHFGEVESWLR